jgi:hypothetical protein
VAGTEDDESSGPSPTGAARAESDDDNTTNDASRSEELDGNLMKNDSSGRNWGKGVGFEHPLRILCDIKVSSLVMDSRLDIGLGRSNQNGILVGSDNDQRV